MAPASTQPIARPPNVAADPDGAVGLIDSEHLGGRQICFHLARRTDGPRSLTPPALTSDHAHALAELLPVLACGEESAAIVFDGIRDWTSRNYAHRRLSSIAADEYRHEMTLRHLRRRLPIHHLEPHVLGALRRFFLRMERRHFARHLTKIVALDSAVCLILGSMRARGLPLGDNSETAEIFRRIHVDEARHVRIARELLRDLDPRAFGMDDAIEARDELTALLQHRAGAFERLKVDPDRLFKKIRVIAPALFA